MHKKNVCKLYKYCEECGRIYRQIKEKHKCGETFCRTCGVIHNRKRGCYIKPIKRIIKAPYRIIAYDFETTFDCEIYAGLYEHRVNLCSAR
jgi:hypothetical protein